MTKVYHFANLTYGLPFLEEYSNVPKSILKVLDITVVFSLNRKPPENWWETIKSQCYKIKCYWQYRNKFKKEPFNILFVSDVNQSRFIEKISKKSIGLCSGFNQIFASDLITRFDEFINVHPSVLPFYRGPVPSYWCLKNKEQQTGYTLHKITSKIDQGEILFQDTVDISKEETESTLDQKIAIAASKILFTWLVCKIEKKAFFKKELNPSQVYTKKVDYLSFPQSLK